MKEELITYKTAVLAKEKGFDLDIFSRYNKDGIIIYSSLLDDEYRQLAPAPTQSLLQRWLREEHKIFVYCIPKGFIKGNGREVIRWGNNISLRKGKYSTTYELALEQGLIEALNLIEI